MKKILLSKETACVFNTSTGACLYLTKNEDGLEIMLGNMKIVVDAQGNASMLNADVFLNEKKD